MPGGLGSLPAHSCCSRPPLNAAARPVKADIPAAHNIYIGLTATQPQTTLLLSESYLRKWAHAMPCCGIGREK
jgi:hypothetical protein